MGTGRASHRDARFTLADEPAACYVAKDPSGEFTPGKVKSFDDYPDISPQIRHLLNQTNRAKAKCYQRHVEREGWPGDGAALTYGLRIGANGKVTQVSVLSASGINDAMLMACVGRMYCSWELAADAEGEERLVWLREYMSEVVDMPRNPTRN